MNTGKYIGDCPSHCGGWLEIMINDETKQLCVRCDECLIQWASPEDARNDLHAYRNPDEWKDLRSAEIGEIENRGWIRFVNDRR